MMQRALRDLQVSAMGLGCMGMSAFYGSTDEDEAIRTICLLYTSDAADE